MKVLSIFTVGPSSYRGSEGMLRRIIFKLVRRVRRLAKIDYPAYKMRQSSRIFTNSLFGRIEIFKYQRAQKFNDWCFQQCFPLAIESQSQGQ